MDALVLTAAADEDAPRVAAVQDLALKLQPLDPRIYYLWSRIEAVFYDVQLADRIVAATPAELAQLQWLYQADVRKTVIIPPGVDLSRFYPIPADEAKAFISVPPCEQLLLFVGRIEPQAGLRGDFPGLLDRLGQDRFLLLRVLDGGQFQLRLLQIG